MLCTKNYSLEKKRRGRGIYVDRPIHHFSFNINTFNGITLKRKKEFTIDQSIYLVSVIKYLLSILLME